MPVAPATADTWRLWIDGTAAPNPGRIGLGVVLESPDGQRHENAVRATEGCNNVAELQALLHGLSLALDAGARAIAIYSDSDFVVRHVGGDGHTDVAPLEALVRRARTAMAAFAVATLHWIPRHRNGAADRLARQAIGLAPKPALRPVSRKRRR
ncbi:ribonuclease HI family protein [Nitrogeniibacter mangrovi]|uniref:Ribonuclease HI family protein n=1 Tax=Nitrogeniibacter mangrovi TaxID=2016596 RepID=A0A6C1B9J1_9RHOO|nr:ribonuclease HI family protein [Nitrogeniibacter mangrovi]QID19010.1 ribonuclease HI family protein [Nitrogeniibacter mangrovi]